MAAMDVSATRPAHAQLITISNTEGQTSRDKFLAIENGVANDEEVYMKQTRREKFPAIENVVVKDKGVYVAVEGDESDDESEVADEDLEITINVQNVAVGSAHNESKTYKMEDCEHSFIVMDDIAMFAVSTELYIEKSILEIIDVNFSKAKRSTRTYASETRSRKFGESDFDSRAHQLTILKQWMEKKSILFLGYKQFSTIVCDDASTESRSCQEILFKVPSILILDEGHTPRNEDSNVLQSFSQVQTPRKGVLSGTLYQNHVKEVFNILNLAFIPKS